MSRSDYCPGFLAKVLAWRKALVEEDFGFSDGLL
jgi:hypothetical protein